MPKFTVRFTVENPNCLYSDVEISAKSEAEALRKAEDINTDSIEWTESEGNSVDTSEIQMDLLEEDDPTLYCTHCGAKTMKQCDCGPIPRND